jgi:hypothetical protein
VLRASTDLSLQETVFLTSTDYSKRNLAQYHKKAQLPACSNKIVTTDNGHLRLSRTLIETTFQSVKILLTLNNSKKFLLTIGRAINFVNVSFFVCEFSNKFKLFSGTWLIGDATEPSGGAHEIVLFTFANIIIKVYYPVSERVCLESSLKGSQWNLTVISQNGTIVQLHIVINQLYKTQCEWTFTVVTQYKIITQI